MKVEYCPNHLMLAYYYTKPLMGGMFKELLYVLMVYKSIFKPEPTMLSSIKERVENHLKYSD